LMQIESASRIRTRICTLVNLLSTTGTELFGKL
jgi:hypothetical protein